MFTPEELNLISYGLLALKDLAEADLLMASESESDFRNRVLSGIAEADALMAKVKSLM